MNKISIIIAIKDYSHNKLCTCIDKIKKQNYGNWEIIIKHNGTKEELNKLKSNFNDKKIKIISCEDSSLGQACNQAMEHATGEIISVFHHDDFFCENAFSTLIENLDDSMWYFGRLNYHVNGKPTSTYYRELVTLNDMKQANYIPQPSCFFKKEVYLEIGKFNEEMKLCWDYDYWVRIMKKWQPKYIDFAFANYYLNDNSISIKVPQFIMESEKYQIQSNI
jgi:glycosyltransferase involved in cell wall biosynthesis